MSWIMCDFVCEGHYVTRLVKMSLPIWKYFFSLVFSLVQQMGEPTNMDNVVHIYSLFYMQYIFGLV